MNKILRLLTYCYISLFLVACNNKNSSTESSLDLGDLIAKGEIKDSVFYGKIDFYNKKTGKLFEERNYVDGILNGEYKKYNDKNKVTIRGNYNDGLPNGYSYYYDTTGNLKLKYFIYYGIRTGPSIEYLNGKPQKYYYYSLDNDVLFTLNYDSINGKGILDIANNFFFINTYNIDNSAEEYRLYNINPPGYDFKYQLVSIDANKQVKDTIQVFNSSNIWHTFKIDKLSNLKANLAISLTVKDSITGKDCFMLKNL